MLYALLCGYPPFLSENEDEIKRKIMRGKFKFGEDWDYISDEVKDLISRILVPESKRPTAKECLGHPWFSMETHQLS
jgi:calcium/calmodulin-dependent protein kinase (CaM kinase) II/calcium/calmodulin-dependent protein kinase I